MPINPGDPVPQDAIVGQPVPSDAIIGTPTPPPPSTGQQILDTLKGAGKGLLSTAAGTVNWAGGLTPQMWAQQLGARAAGLPPDNQPIGIPSPQPQGTPQKVGYYGEKAAEVLAPLGVGGAAIVRALPSTERAGAAIQSVTDAAGPLPVDTSGPMQIAQRIQQLGSRGGGTPKVISDFLKRMGVSVEGETVTQAPSRLTFAEGRDFYNNATRLASGEAQNLTPPVLRLVGQFKGSLHDALTASADQIGMGPTYANAIQEYGAGSSLQRGAAAVGKYLLKQGLQWGPAALGYGGYEAWKNR